MVFLPVVIFTVILFYHLVAAEDHLKVPYTVDRIIISDQKLIEYILETQMIVEDSTVTALSLFDMTGEGFADNDILMTHPQMNVYILSVIPDSLLEIMKGWGSVVQVQLNLPADITGQDVRSMKTKIPKGNRFRYSLLEALLKVVDNCYSGVDLSIAFKRDSLSTTIEVWDYDKSKVDTISEREILAGDTIEYYDILFMTNTDTVYMTDTVYYDMIYIYSSTNDTIFLPRDLPPKGRRIR